MQVKNRLDKDHPYFHSKTKLQWEKEKRAINEDAEGMELWSNQICQVRSFYYREEETHPASEAERKAWRIERNRIARERYAERKARKIQEKEAEIARAWRKAREEQARIEREREKKRQLRETDRAKIICLDVETTGLDKWDDEILQLSIIDGNRNVLFNEYIRPKTKEEWDEAEKIHGISPLKVAGKPNIDIHIPLLNRIFADAELIVGYNHEYFDMKFIQNAGVTVPENIRMYDVMLEFAPVYGEWNERFGNYRWQKLSTCAKYYGYNNAGDFHDSLEDVRATLHCFFAMIGE